MIKQILGWILLAGPFVAMSIFLWKELGYKKVFLYWGVVAACLSWAVLVGYLIS